MKYLPILSVSIALSLFICACTEQQPASAPQTAAPIKAAQQAAEKSAANLGQLTYQANCAACHDTGVAGAPKIGDQSTWSEHAAHGSEHLLSAVVDGKGAMPPRAGNPGLSDAEITAAIEYILTRSR